MIEPTYPQSLPELKSWVYERVMSLSSEILYSSGQSDQAKAAGLPDLKGAARKLQFTDVTAARALKGLFGDELTFVNTNGKDGVWYFWNGVHHQSVASGRVVRLVTESYMDLMTYCLRTIKEEYERLANGKSKDEAAKVMARYEKYEFGEHREFRTYLHKEGGQSALARSFTQQCTVEADFFDEDRDLLVLQNGVLDLNQLRRDRFITLLPHSPSRAVSRAADISYNPEATAPRWEPFLESSQPDESLRLYLQRLAGAAYMAQGKVKAIPNLVGPQDCGKSVFVSTLSRIAGGYGVEPSPDALMQTQGGQNWEQETLRGKRFVGISEPSVNKRLDDSFCKSVTGGDSVRTRGMRKESTGWVAQCVMFIASNQAVRLNTKDQAFLNRIGIVEFPHRFWPASEAPEGEIHIMDGMLEETLAGESEGIFNWVVQGMLDFLDRNIDTPAQVKAARKEIRTNSSSALRWLHEREEDGLLEIAWNVEDCPKSHYALLSNLYTHYQREALTDGERVLSKTQFREDLESELGPVLRAAGTRIPRVVGINDFAHLNLSAKEKDALQRF